MANIPKISVIIPVYNAEKYLYRCIDSVLAQTYQDFELLLIDDGSKDSSGVICDEYAAKDARVRVFHKENGGVSSARNLGLDNARGEWITFVDSDDWIKPLYLEHLMICAHTSDLVITYATVFSDNDNKGVKEKYPEHDITAENFSLLFEQNAMSWHTSPWSKLYKRKIIENYRLRFEEDVHIGEDAIFLYSYMLQANEIKIVCYTDYCYRSEIAGSLTKRVYSLQSELSGMQKIHSLVDQMVCNKKLSPKARRELNWLKASYINRVLNALYIQEIPCKSRRIVLRNLDIDCYVHNFYPDSLKTKMLVKMLDMRLYDLYDMCRWLVTYMKGKICV